MVSLQSIRDSLAQEEEQMQQSILTANPVMRKVLRRMGFNIAEPGEEENRDTDEDHDEPMQELPTPTQETWDPERESKVKPRKAMLFDGPEQPTGPETPEERRSRLVRESLIAHARMQVFKTHYSRNKKTYLEMRKELGDDVCGEDAFPFEAYDGQGNAHAVEVDDECEYSPTSAGGEVQGPVGPTPPSEPEGSGPGGQREEAEGMEPKPRSEPTGSEGSEGKGGQKGKSHRTWRSMTPERMKKEDFVALKHPWAPWPEFIDDEEKAKATSTSGTATTGQAMDTEITEPKPDGLPAIPEGADPEWWKPGAYSQNYVLLEEAEARRAEMDEEDSRAYTEEEWQKLSPWRQERIRELWKKKGKGKGTKPKYPNEPRGPHEPDCGPNQGGPASGSGDGGTIAVRMMRRNDGEEEDEWGFVEDDRQIAQGSVAAKMMAKAKSSAGPMLRAPRTEGELPVDRREPREQGVREPQGGRHREWLGGIFPMEDPEGEVEERFVGPFHFGGGRGPVLKWEREAYSYFWE